MRALDYSDLNKKLMVEYVRQRKQGNLEKIRNIVEEIAFILYIIFVGIFILSL